jgi:ferredoxin
MRGTWRVEVDRERCMGTGACVFAAPEVFALDSHGVSTVVGEIDDDDQVIRNAVAECPTAALRLISTKE